MNPGFAGVPSHGSELQALPRSHQRFDNHPIIGVRVAMLQLTRKFFFKLQVFVVPLSFSSFRADCLINSLHEMELDQEKKY